MFGVLEIFVLNQIHKRTIMQHRLCARVPSMEEVEGDIEYTKNLTARLMITKAGKQNV